MGRKKTEDQTKIDKVGYRLLIGNILDFATTARLVEQGFFRVRDNDALPSIKEGSCNLASVRTVSHFNLGMALELMLKLLLLCNGKGYDTEHRLTYHYGKLPLAVQQQLESTYQEILGDGIGGLAHIFFISPPAKQSPFKNRNLSSLRGFFEYFDEDVRLWVKRYEWEVTDHQHSRHYLCDLSVFLEFIDRVMRNTERYIAPEDGAEHGGAGLPGPSQEG